MIPAFIPIHTLSLLIVIEVFNEHFNLKWPSEDFDNSKLFQWIPSFLFCFIIDRTKDVIWSPKSKRNPRITYLIFFVLISDPRIYVYHETSFFLYPRKLIPTKINESTVTKNSKISLKLPIQGQQQLVIRFIWKFQGRQIFTW